MTHGVNMAQSHRACITMPAGRLPSRSQNDRAYGAHGGNDALRLSKTGVLAAHYGLLLGGEVCAGGHTLHGFLDDARTSAAVLLTFVANRLCEQ